MARGSGRVGARWTCGGTIESMSKERTRRESWQTVITMPHTIMVVAHTSMLTTAAAPAGGARRALRRGPSSAPRPPLSRAAPGRARGPALPVSTRHGAEPLEQVRVAVGGRVGRAGVPVGST